MNTEPRESARFDLRAWDALHLPGRRHVADGVAARLSDRFSLVGLESHALGETAHEVAVFEHEGDRFVLVPGFSGWLGYDRSCPFAPSPEQGQDWEHTEAEIGLSLHDYLDLCLSPLRDVTLKPLLVEMEAKPFPYGQDGAGRMGDESAIRAACGDGFRLPSPDEWEYACAAGARSLFRWGDDCPNSCSYDERGFDLHRRPNAFGLRLPWNTYDLELCEGRQFRGGDGGGAVHGGLGNVVTWIPLASAFRIPEDKDLDGWCIEEVWVRRVYPLAT